MSPVNPENLRRLDRYLARGRGPWGAVFDIGTRAARVLVGPRPPPADAWPKGVFFNDSLLTNLGAEVRRQGNRIALDSPVLQALVGFLRSYRQHLIGRGVAPEHMEAIGTAVFRWLDNADEVVALVEREAGVRVTVLGGDEEALYSLASVAATHHLRRGDTPTLDPDDAILLLDQGGGSMEVSYLLPSEPDRWEVHSFDQLGTIALRERFFAAVEAGLLQSSGNPCHVSTHGVRAWAFAREQVSAWPGYPELQGRRLHAYAMGSAITRISRGSNHQAHNRWVSISRMLREMDEACSWFDAHASEVSAVIEALKAEEVATTRRHRDTVGQRLVLLYGLPVYAAVLERFGLEGTRLCGYGLRYGAFIWRHGKGLPLG